jgi:cytochrome c biogenesis protein CcdA
MPVLEALDSQYPELVVDYREMRNYPNNFNLMQAYGENYNILDSEKWYTPTTFVNDKYLVGTKDFSNFIISNIISCNNNDSSCKCNFDNNLARYYNTTEFSLSTNSSFSTINIPSLTIPAVIGSAMVASFNPCAFAVIIFLLSYLVNAVSKKRMLFLGGVYIISVFLSNILIGLSVFAFVKNFGLSNIFYYLSAIVSIIFGLINIKDFFWYGKWITLNIPSSKKSLISKLAKNVTSFSAIILGIVVSIFGLPCTIGPYSNIIALLENSSTFLAAFPLLILYNIIFVLPLIIITLLAYYGNSSKGLEDWRTKNKNYMKLIAGIFLVIIGAIMILSK